MEVGRLSLPGDRAPSPYCHPADWSSRLRATSPSGNSALIRPSWTLARAAARTIPVLPACHRERGSPPASDNHTQALGYLRKLWALAERQRRRGLVLMTGWRRINLALSEKKRKKWRMWSDKEKKEKTRKIKRRKRKIFTLHPPFKKSKEQSRFIFDREIEATSGSPFLIQTPTILCVFVISSDDWWMVWND